MGQKLDTEGYILIVEDSPVDYEIVTRALKKAAIDRPVHHCESGDEALDFLSGKNGDAKEKGLPSLILLDIKMPGMDGRVVLDKIKQHEALKHIPVIMLTTSSNDHDIETCYVKGANSYLTKPTMPDDYVEMAKSLKSFWFEWAKLPKMLF